MESEPYSTTDRGKPGISGVLITYQAEKYLASILEAIGPLCEEIIIVDSGSTDRTEAIARSAGARFVREPWRGYGPQKNFANSLATQPYILSLDADELPDATLLRALHQAKQEGLRGAYRFCRLPIWCGRPVRHSGWYPDYKVRLFPSAGTQWSDDPVHEKLLLPPHIPITNLPGHLLHYSYTSKASHLEKTLHYARLQAIGLSQKSPWVLHLGRWLKPPFTFIRHFILWKGFLDGLAGYHIARITALGVRERYTQALRLKNQRLG
ncbi:MAG: glycosyltransferase family 2 protein [Flavobacteriales bacterium]|nr:glycosyltransferase family 2 protein [Flavobacteriales bacterium]MDW8410357.1 glycosyltransferase family 2 protein [Flavobacteriales bacterium]